MGSACEIMTTMTDLEKINDLFHEYSSEDVISASKSDEAFASDVYDIVTSRQQRYFLKILRSQRAEAIESEVLMQKRLLSAGIATPEYIEITPGSYIGVHGNERFLLSRYIPGTSPKVVSPTLMKSLGATLAKLHNCLAGLVVPGNDMQWLNPTKVSKDVDSYDGPAKESLKSLLDYGSAIFSANLPRAMTHGDLWLSNVFAENDEVTTVFDLETAEETVRIVDIARTYTSIRFNSDYSLDEVVDSLIAGYDSAANQKLTPEELSNIKRAIVYVCAACAVWHAVHGTRYTDPYIEFANEILEQEA